MPSTLFLHTRIPRTLVMLPICVAELLSQQFFLLLVGRSVDFPWIARDLSSSRSEAFKTAKSACCNFLQHWFLGFSCEGNPSSSRWNEVGWLQWLRGAFFLKKTEFLHCWTVYTAMESFGKKMMEVSIEAWLPVEESFEVEQWKSAAVRD